MSLELSLTTATSSRTSSTVRRPRCLSSLHFYCHDYANDDGHDDDDDDNSHAPQVS